MIQLDKTNEMFTSCILHKDGGAPISVEVPVMGVKRGGSLIRLRPFDQPKGRSHWSQQKAADHKVSRRDDKSRIRREFHVLDPTVGPRGEVRQTSSVKKTPSRLPLHLVKLADKVWV